MCAHSVVGIFCDDLRNEAGGRESLMGVYPDNVNVPAVPGAFPRMCTYVRIHLDPNQKPKSIQIRLDGPDDSVLETADVEEDVISRSYDNAKKNGHPYCGIISRIMMSPFPINKAGKFNIVASIDGQAIICGSMNIGIKTET